ncbi:hypothetical protein HanRHA438_Chr07g0321861 [Helianthus annuus]|nr:hypothetical protein HanRHA438_Chr07g0321861 [Helianthus annuus]
MKKFRCQIRPYTVPPKLAHGRPFLRDRGCDSKTSNNSKTKHCLVDSKPTDDNGQVTMPIIAETHLYQVATFQHILLIKVNHES